jgi:hypothetical protein
MGRTKKVGSKQSKTRKNKKEKEDNLEDLYSETESETDTGSVTGSETETETDTETDSQTNEVSFDNMKDYDMTISVLGFSLIAVLGFAIYKRSSL